VAPLAGFQVITIGRFWVIPEAKMALRPKSFVHQEILAPLGHTKGELTYVAKKGCLVV
jgi:hypothetical protein